MRLRTGRVIVPTPRLGRRREPGWTPPASAAVAGATSLRAGPTLIRYPMSGGPGAAPCVDAIVADPSVSNEDQAAAWPDYVCVPSLGYSSPSALELAPDFYVTVDDLGEPDVTYEVSLGGDDGESLFMQRPNTATLNAQGVWELTTSDADDGTYSFRCYSDGPVLVGQSIPTPHLIPIGHRLCANGGRVTAVVEEGSDVGLSFRWKAPSGRVGSIRYWFVDADYDPINATYQPTGFLDTTGLPYYETATNSFAGSGGSWATFDVTTVRGYLPAPAGAVGVVIGLAVYHPGVSANAGDFVYFDEITIEVA